MDLCPPHAHLRPPPRLPTIAADSTRVEPERLLEAAGGSKLRFLSVDGGHSRAVTLSDLRLADAVVADGGIVCLDDVFNAAWSGVISGLVDYLAGPSARLVPFAIAPNKVFFARAAHAAGYAAFLRAEFSDGLMYADREMFDFRVDYFGDMVPAALARRLGLDPPQPDAPEAVATVRRANADLNRQLSAVLGSWSWRVTAPLRLVDRLVRQGAKRRTR